MPFGLFWTSLVLRDSDVAVACALSYDAKRVQSVGPAAATTVRCGRNVPSGPTRVPASAA